MTSTSDSATESPFYSNLKLHNRQIRLLEIVSTQPEIVCKLEIASLENELVFSAISYVWGDPKITKDIIVNGKKTAITTNLAYALEYVPGHLDQAKAPSRLWVDAICINQDDTKEKNHQVPLMKDIFSMADTVLCWMGPPKKIMFRAIDIIELVAHERAVRGGDGLDDELQRIFIDLARNMQAKAKAFDYVLDCGKAPPNLEESLQTHDVLGETEAHELAHSLQSAIENISQSLDTPCRIKPIHYVGFRHIMEAFQKAQSCLYKFRRSMSQADAEDRRHVLELLIGTTKTLHKKLRDLVQRIDSSRRSVNSKWIYEHALIYDKSKSALNDDRTGLGVVGQFFCIQF
ncbi:hypothetical protein FDECE_10876 [Fusarium decemcellulare]|nr:hypothetical protein FDECE_10876 [Fusarium decemcellulare]